MAPQKRTLDSKIERIKKQQKELDDQLKVAKRKAKLEAKVRHQQKIYEAGKLVEMAGLLEVDRGRLLEYLLQNKWVFEDKEECARLQKIGAEMLEAQALLEEKNIN